MSAGMADQAQREEEEEEEEEITEIWSWGAGTHGQLASGDFADHLEPLPLSSFGMGFSTSTDSACTPKILHMAGGGAHAVAIVGSKGHEEVVTWGNGQSGALGQGDESDLCVPALVKYFQGIQISSVAAGWSHTAFLAKSGELYTCGNGSFGQLGHGDLEARLAPSKVKTLPCKAVSMVACGMRHTLVLAQGSGSETYAGPAVYGFGSSKRGQLGIGTLDEIRMSQGNLKNTGKVPVPQRVVGLQEHHIVFLAANGDHSAALTERGGLWIWGRGFDGSSDAPVPGQVESRLQFSQVALGWNHCIALAGGQLWAWGSNLRGQLGLLKDSSADSDSLTFINNMSKDSESLLTAQTMIGETQGEGIAADRDSCIKHVQGITTPQTIPSLSCCERVEVLSAAAVTNKDQVDKGTGSHEEGCRSEKQSPEMIMVGGLEGKLVRWLSAGAEHSAIVLEDGRIMTWGWGEHGQLGLGSVQDQLYPKVVTIPSIQLEGNLCRTFCGSGFTFAIADRVADT